jgi:hydrogenase/urease accessory protein HupE
MTRGLALRFRSNPRLGVITGLCMLAWSATLSAHEIGTSRVLVAIDGSNRYQVEIVTDALSLLDKLEVLSGQSAGPISDVPPVRIEARLVEFEPIFRQRVMLAFDGVSSQPSMRFAVVPADVTNGPAAATSVPGATITLTGEVPAGARQFTWSYGWTFASYALSVRRAGSSHATTVWLEGGQLSRPIVLDGPVRKPNRIETAARYVMLGFTHILPKGADHVLFVLGLFLLSRRAKPLLAQVSAFTVAHSITLALSMYHIARLSPSIVEPLIAISIAYVALENLIVADLTRWRVALVFAFGLLHGLGFAGALGELGLPRSEFVTALVGFNLGVETGQLTVIGAAFAIVGWPWGSREWYRRLIVVPASAAIAGIAVYWTIQRIAW